MIQAFKFGVLLNIDTEKRLTSTQAQEIAQSLLVDAIKALKKPKKGEPTVTAQFVTIREVATPVMK